MNLTNVPELPKMLNNFINVPNYEECLQISINVPNFINYLCSFTKFKSVPKFKKYS